MDALLPAPTRRTPLPPTASAGVLASAGFTRYLPTGKYTVPPCTAAALIASCTFAVSSVEPSPVAP